MKALFTLLGLSLIATTQASETKTTQDSKYEVLCFGRHAPERKDDFTWENDRVAFRMYGPACGKTENVLSGIDIWSKKIATPVIDLWYKRNDAGENYHTDRGEGADFYKVGPTLGAGGLGFIADDQLLCTKYWAKSRILEQGPQRIVFELDFEPLKVGKATVTETKRITLERGSNLNKIECSFKIEGADSVVAAAGIRKSHKEGYEMKRIEKGISYSELADKKQVIFSGLLMKDNKFEFIEAHDHYLLKTTIKNGAKLTYYAGAGWLQSGQFKSFTDWSAYLKKVSK